MKKAKSVDGCAINDIASSSSCSRFDPLQSACRYNGSVCSCRTIHEKRIIYKLPILLEKFFSKTKVEEIRSYLYSKGLYK